MDYTSKLFSNIGMKFKDALKVRSKKSDGRINQIYKGVNSIGNSNVPFTREVYNKYSPQYNNKSTNASIISDSIVRVGSNRQLKSRQWNKKGSPDSIIGGIQLPLHKNPYLNINRMEMNHRKFNRFRKGNRWNVSSLKFDDRMVVASGESHIKKLMQETIETRRARSMRHKFMKMDDGLPKNPELQRDNTTHNLIKHSETETDHKIEDSYNQSDSSKFDTQRQSGTITVPVTTSLTTRNEANHYNNLNGNQIHNNNNKYIKDSFDIMNHISDVPGTSISFWTEDVIDNNNNKSEYFGMNEEIEGQLSNINIKLHETSPVENCIHKANGRFSSLLNSLRKSIDKCNVTGSQILVYELISLMREGELNTNTNINTFPFISLLRFLGLIATATGRFRIPLCTTLDLNLIQNSVLKIRVNQNPHIEEDTSKESVNVIYHRKLSEEMMTCIVRSGIYPGFGIRF